MPLLSWLLAAHCFHGASVRYGCWYLPLAPRTSRINVPQTAGCPGNILTGAAQVPELDESAAHPELQEFLIVVLSDLVSCSQSEKTCQAGQDPPERLPRVPWQRDNRQGSSSRVEETLVFSPWAFLRKGGQSRWRCHSWYLESLFTFTV